MLLLLLLICLQTSLQQDLPAGRCDTLKQKNVYTTCTSWAAFPISHCPPGFSKVKGSAGYCTYVLKIGGREHEISGLRPHCRKNYMYPMCCPQHWGPLCLPCPSWSGKTCNFRGTCEDGDQNNGTCVCEENFSGFSCHECKNPNSYGENCDKECDCVHGVCNKGPDGDGQCLCQPPYTGKRCDQVSNRCSSCTQYSYCKGEGDDAYCECLPGYRKSSRNTCTRVCSQKDCDVNAQCSSQGSKVVCTCKPDYEGDGKVCVPRNPCSENNGGCPVNSTVCVFDGPNKSICKCMFGMSPIGGDPKSGCQLVSACFSDTCHPTATCQTGVDGQPRCVCGESQIGDDYRCYDNLMDRLLQLELSRDHRDNMTLAVSLFENGCYDQLRHSRSLTVFLPLVSSLPTGVNQKVLCQRHIILGHHRYADLTGKAHEMYGGGLLRTKELQKFILLGNPSRVYTVIQKDLPAANGVIHIIDKVIMDRFSDKSTRDERFAGKTIGEILSKDGRYNRFLSLVDNCGSPPPLKGRGPLTVFIPTNEAVDRARDGSILYMLHDAKHKLQELLRHHVFSQAVLTADELSALPQIQTMANQKVVVNVSANGEILLGEKGVRLVTKDIVASNGIIHMIDGLLYPPSILPILPHRCDIVQNKITMGPCVHCSSLHETRCPDGSVEMDRHQICEYVTLPANVHKGCAKFCNTTFKVEECCKGFYGPDCKPCIGGFKHPCYDKGTCFDGISGNGSCSCQPGLKGIACHLCVDPAKHGDNCDEDCHCVHGVCDSRPGSGGVCRNGSCFEGYSGPNCDKMAMPCNSDGMMEHCHIHAYCTHNGLNNICACRDGYEGDGHSCTPINLCLKSSRGGCDTNAECTYVGPGNVSCVCGEGWTGDGQVCVEINNCQLESRGGCSPNANCNHIGPGQSECVCKIGYMGDGIICDFIDPCSISNGGCHVTATCAQTEGGAHTCTCPEGLAGDGQTCYGTILEELDSGGELFPFNHFVEDSLGFTEDLSGNITLLVPFSEAMVNMTSDEYMFWNNRHRLRPFLRAHILQGIYSLEDLETLVGQSLPTLHPPTRWEISNTSGVIHVGDAPIITPNMPAINGYIHIIHKILMLPRSDLPPDPPTLMAFLNTSSNFTLFREYAQLYNLSGYLGQFTFTLLLPTDEAIRQDLQRTNSSKLDGDVVKYHVLRHGVIFPDTVSDGTLKSTVLGSRYQVQFHRNHSNQTFVNDVLLDGSFIETQNGVLIVLNQVLKVRQNRCDKPVTLRKRGKCADCEGKPQCYYRYEPVRPEFPVNMRSNCKFRKRAGGRRKTVPGCVMDCTQVTTDHSCCPGYYGHECFKCPGEVGSWCSNHGECQDGHLGNGECRCYEGFHGTACEDCEPGRYGVNCSSKCVCSHGKCDDGLAGSGKCMCYKGWKGSTCSIEIKDDACGGRCDENANCITGPNGQAAVCLCAAGYEGNGTYCKELDLCSRSNGGCSEFATCTKVSAGERTCSCKAGYTGDGVVCLEIDGCLVNNGGCQEFEECVRAGPNITSCRCQEGFIRRRWTCERVNPCRLNNGGCNKYANCEYFGQGQRNCTCHRGYIGDGFDCHGTTDKEISRNPENSFFQRMLQMSEGPGLYSRGPFTVFSPVEETNETLIQTWNSAGRVTDLTFYHVVSCETLNFTDLKTTERAISVLGHALHFSVREGAVWINNRSRIVKSDYATSNGVIHHIDKLLTPYRLEDKLPIRRDSMNLTTAASFYGYSRFSTLLEESGVLPLLDMSIHQPYTVFWPTNEALDSMPAQRWRWLTSPDNNEQLAAIVKAHIIRSYKIQLSSPFGFTASYRTMHGSTIQLSCDKSLVGNLLINGNGARIEERFLNFRVGIAYGIDQLLEPPGLGAHCDDIENKTVFGRCGRCSVPPSCSFRHIDTGGTVPCFDNGRGRGYSFSRHYRSMGCKRICMSKSWIHKCCKNHYGRDCQVCPGGLEAPCGNKGSCNDGILGLGDCRCNKGSMGTSCERCQRNYYGLNCTACSCGKNGKCDDGVDGSGLCTCNSGWEGDQCQRKVGSIPKECQQCHANALCLTGVGCRCKSGFEGNGTSCSPEPPPDLCAEYNGGCHQNANCSQTGQVVNCTCQSGYQGDGFECEPINRCVEEPNGGCSDFATCTFTGPNERTCECQSGYVGNGVQCLEKAVPPVDRCLEDNGGCDPVASCKDLHYHANTAGVFHLRSPEGKYKMNFSQADAACQAEGATLVSFKQLGDAQQLGMHLCVAGWMEGGKVGYPTRYPSIKCGENHVGLVMYKEPVDQSSKYDAYCYRLNDVSCSCPREFVGNGDFCHGVLTSVLATYNNFSIFYKFLVDYSSSSPAGQRLVDVLSHRQSNVTIFVPHNAGFAQNQTLSARDLEYHISTNHSNRLYSDLRHQETIASRLGFNLTVTADSSENRKLVNKRLLVEWDIPAVNGIIHVIEAPLTAPPPPIFHSPARGHARSSSAALTILVTVLLACVLAAVGYYLLKHKNDNFRFRYFKNEDENDSPGGRNKPTLVSIPNPLYNASRAFNEPFGETSQQGAEPAESEDPPNLLDVDQ
ncbi:stabilin-1 [Salarias fasciatus]|uniref:stabilin-1 n=1 Tax=Salarias fasciatus TaxID=181472 RepID=UPI0011764B22|nr:stabilin-1 [Salarias fasciatus]